MSKLRKGNLFVIYIRLQTTATTTTTTKFITLTIPPSILGSLQCRHHFNHHIYYFSSIDTTTFLLRFSSTTTTTTFIMLSLRCYYRHYKSINLCKPRRLVNFYCSWTEDSAVVYFNFRLFFVLIRASFPFRHPLHNKSMY